MGLCVFFFFKQKTAYEMRISDWSSDVCSSDLIAQILAFLGVRPQWEPASGRVTGFEILPLSVLERPRVDVTVRVSGFFRDAFPHQIDLIDSAVRDRKRVV